MPLFINAIHIEERSAELRRSGGVQMMPGLFVIVRASNGKLNTSVAHSRNLIKLLYTKFQRLA